MNPHDKYRLRFNRLQLVENINPVNPVLDFLIGKETITPDMAEDILAESNSQVGLIHKFKTERESQPPCVMPHHRPFLYCKGSTATFNCAAKNVGVWVHSDNT